jgi:hypothetical protein
MKSGLAYLDGIDSAVAVNSDEVAEFFSHPLDAEAAVETRAEPDEAPAPSPLLKSELASVTDKEWTSFVVAMKTAAVDSVSGSNALGAWEMRPKRLADLDLMTNLRYGRTPLGRLACDGDFRLPLTKRKFLENAGVQYRVFATSMRRYVDGLNDGTVAQPANVPTDMTLSGALAILHRCGPGGLVKWSDKESRFSDTADLYGRVNGLF